MTATEPSPLESSEICFADLKHVRDPAALIQVYLMELKRRMPRHGYKIIFREWNGPDFKGGKFVAVPTEDPSEEGELDEKTLLAAFRKS